MQWLAVPSCIIGAVLIGFSAFLYETEEKQIDEALARWWVQFDGVGTAAMSSSVTFARRISSSIVAWLNALFGDRVLSSQAITVSTWLSFSSYFLLRGAEYVIRKYPGHHNVFDLPLITAVSATCFYVACSDSRTVRRWRTAMALAAIITLASWYLVNTPVYVLASFCIAMVLGITVDVVAIMLSRSSARIIGLGCSPPRGIAIVAGNVLLATLCMWAPMRYARFHVANDAVAATLSFFWHYNCFAAVVAASFVVLPFTLLVQRLTWPALSRVLYATHRFDVLHNRKLLLFSGTALLAIGLPPLSEALKAVAAQLLP